jgi:hypothetical protein
MYNFTPNQLDTIHDMLEINAFVRPAYRWYHDLDESIGINTTDVEEWVIEFYNAYNKIYPNTY